MAVELDEDAREVAFKQELDESLQLIKEDVCEWLTRLLALQASPLEREENWLQRIDDGVLLCRLAQLLDQLLGDGTNKPAPRFSLMAHSGTFLARDNISMFLKWCRECASLRDEILFETNGLVHHSEERNVLLTLLELARVAGRAGLHQLPQFVRLEKEIDQQECDAEAAAELSSHAPVAAKRICLKSAKPHTEVDRKLQEQLALCTCTPSLMAEKLYDGKYLLGGRSIFLRIVKNHMMVRVGGGWTTLAEYLAKHDVCRMVHVPRGNGCYAVVQGKVRYRLRSAVKTSSVRD